VNKPYSVCIPCGVQIFFRGKTGISRLRLFLDRGQPVTNPIAPAAPAVIAFTRLEQLRAHRKRIRAKTSADICGQGSRNAISAIDAEIARAQIALTQLANERER
jgi:hypothetical protein